MTEATSTAQSMSTAICLQVMLSLILLLMLQLPQADGNIVNCGYCVCERSSMTCDFDGAKDRVRDSIRLDQFVPTSAQLRGQGLEPYSFEDLYINCKNNLLMQQQHLTKGLLSELSNLKKVAIVRCDLEAIEPDAFQGLYKLEEFDASDNNLQLLPPRMFGALKMKLVKLSENKRLQLDSQSFLGLALQRLILSKCQLAEFPTGALFHITGLKELTLSENRIRYVPNSALALVSKLEVFYLDSNPLACTCANKWLRESVNWEALSPSVMRNSKLPTCKSPFNLMDIELTKVEPARFLCSPPHIASVTVSLQPEAADIACAALTDEQSDQPLAWFYRSFGTVAESAAAERGPLFRRRVSRTPGLASERFALRVVNSGGQSAEFNLTIAWPPSLSRTQSPRPPPLLPGETTEESPQQPPPAAVLPENVGGIAGVGGDPQRPGQQQQENKQFTLLEMIIAVIGTFMSTSLVFLLSCQFVRWYKRRDKKLWATYASQQQQTQQQQQQQQYSATYNYNPHPASSHEYDVPRIDQPCLPKPPPPPTTTTLSQVPTGGGSSSMSSSDREFLDYNNPRLMYNV